MFVGLRYLRAKGDTRFVSFISFSAFAGMALGVLAVIVVLSVMNGFEYELRSRILGATEHVIVSHKDGQLDDWQSYLEKLAKPEQVMGVAPYISGQALLRHGDFLQGVEVRGVDPAYEPQVSTIKDNMFFGELDSLQAGKYGILLGRHLALSLNLRIGDPVDVMLPLASVTPAGVIPRFRRCYLRGVFEFNSRDHDGGLALIHIRDAQRLFRLGKAVTGVRAEISNLEAAPALRRQLSQQWPDVLVQDWTQTHQSFFEAVRTEKIAMSVILSFIIFVAAANIISTLILVVANKQPEIAILLTLGASRSQILRIFMVQGATIGISGVGFGVLIGLLLAEYLQEAVSWLEQLAGSQILPPDLFYISTLPSEINSMQVLAVAAGGLFLSVTATLYPAWRASRIWPADALRYE